jgi:hypothetical protein
MRILDPATRPMEEYGRLDRMFHSRMFGEVGFNCLIPPTKTFSEAHKPLSSPWTTNSYTFIERLHFVLPQTARIPTF